MAEFAAAVLEKNWAYLRLCMLEVAIARLQHSKKLVPAAMLQRQCELAAEYEWAMLACFWASSRWARDLGEDD